MYQIQSNHNMINYKKKEIVCKNNKNILIHLKNNSKQNYTYTHIITLSDTAVIVHQLIQLILNILHNVQYFTINKYIMHFFTDVPYPILFCANTNNYNNTLIINIGICSLSA